MVNHYEQLACGDTFEMAYTIEENVYNGTTSIQLRIIGSGAQIIGPITVGRRARVGANAVVTEDVPEGATMIGLKARSTLVPAETWLKEFIPYGTPCDEPCEPDTRRIEELESRLAQLADELAKLRAASLADGDGEPLPAPDERQRSGTGS
jgi:serine O-acetyltransferase